MRALRTARTAAGAIAPLILASLAAAADDVPQVRKNPPRLAPDTSWSLRLPKEEKILYRGVASFDAAAGPGAGMLYPAPNAAGLLVAVLTHGAIVETAKKKERDRLQAEADKILVPYQPVLGEHQHKQLMQRALDRLPAAGRGKLIEPAEKPGAGWWIETTPVFSMTQDQRAFVLDNVISMYAPDDPSAPAYQNAVRVISVPAGAADLVVFWSANQGEKLKEESALLFAESLDVALAEAAAGPARDDNAQKTIRYLEGGKEKMERAQFMGERCDRILIRTLRGALMSVPPRRGPDEAPAGRCGGRQGKAQ